MTPAQNLTMAPGEVKVVLAESVDEEVKRGLVLFLFWIQYGSFIISVFKLI